MSLVRLQYEKTDARVAEVVRRSGAKVSCKKGCIHCCALMCSITAPEAEYLAKEICAREDWYKWITKLGDHAHLIQDVMDQGEWFRKRVLCPLLGDDDLCAFYDARPAACRYHIVVSDPELCSPASEHAKTTCLNLLWAESEVWGLVELERSCTPVMAPLSLMVLEVLRLSDGPSAGQLEAAKLAMGECSPSKWFYAYMASDAAKIDAANEIGMLEASLKMQPAR